MSKSGFAVLALTAFVPAILSATAVNSYTQTNLTSDLPGVAANQDPNLVNPWGIVAGPGGPFWINDNGKGLSTLYGGSGANLSLVVTVPPPTGTAGPAAPTGIVFNGTSSFGGSNFIFDTEDGTVSAWISGTKANLEWTAPAGSVYKGLAVGNIGSANFLYAANFGLGRIDVYDSNFHPTSVAGNFSDANIPSGYAPFDVQNIGGNLYVTYAKQDAKKHDDVAGPGNGFIDVFDMNGNFLKRLVSKGALNSPWGLAVAPAGFGAFGSDLLVGNFGDGRINAYNPTTGAFAGTLDNKGGTPLTIEGLWGLSFGNGSFGTSADSLYFTAGIPGPGVVEDHGLFGSLSASAAAPEPGTSALFGLAALGGFGYLLRRRSPRAKLQSL